MKLKINNDVISVKSDGELLIYNMNTHKYLRLKGTAYHVWQCIESIHDKGLIVSHMINEYQGDPEVIRHDIDQLITDMLHSQLILVEN